jgi:hypothetical protein
VQRQEAKPQEEKEASLAKIQPSLFSGSLCSTAADGLALGVEVLVSLAPVPGLTLALGALKCLYEAVNGVAGGGEEAARIAAYCGATTAALSRYAGLVKPSDAEALRLLADATRALKTLQGLVEAQASRGTLAKLFFSSAGYREAAHAAEQEVDRAVRMLMFLATERSMADAAAVNVKVDALLKKRCPPHPPPEP